MLVLHVDVALEDSLTAAFDFPESPILLGTGPLSDLVLDLPWVSQTHAMVHFGGEGVRFVDLGSKNGSVVGRHQAMPNVPVEMSTGDDVKIGALTLRLSLRPPTSATIAQQSPRRYFGAEGTAGEANRVDAGGRRDTAAFSEVPSPLLVRDQAWPSAFRPLTRHILIPAPGAQPSAVVREVETPPRSPAIPPTEVLRDDWASSAKPAEATRHLRQEAPPTDAGRADIGGRMRRLAATTTIQGDRQLLRVLVMLAEHAVETFTSLRETQLSPAVEGEATTFVEATGLADATPAEILAYLLDDIGEAETRIEALRHATAQLLANRREIRSGGDPHADPTFENAPLSRSHRTAGEPNAGGVLPSRAAEPLVLDEDLRIAFDTGPLAGREYGLILAEITIGRGEDNVIPLHHSSVSRRHVAIVKRGTSWEIRDAGSRNGLVVNGTRASVAPLGAGDVVELGDVRFRVTAREKTGRSR